MDKNFIIKKDYTKAIVNEPDWKHLTVSFNALPKYGFYDLPRTETEAKNSKQGMTWEKLDWTKFNKVCGSK